MKKKNTKAGISSVSGQRAAVQFHHQGNQVQLLGFGARHQLGDVAVCVDDIGVGEQQIIGSERPRVL